MSHQQHRRNFSIDFEKLANASKALNHHTRLNSEDILLSITTSSSSIPTLESQRQIHSTPQFQSNNVLNLEPKANTSRHRSRHSLYTINKCQELANTLNQITFSSSSRSSKSRSEGFVACNNKGVELDKEGKYEEALECYDKAIILKPDYPDAYFNKGSTLDNLGRYEEAITCYDTAIKLNPNNPDAYYNKGVSLDSLGRYEEAISCYEKAISLKPDYFGAYNNKGILLDHLGKYEEAIESFNHAILLRPDSSDGYFNKGSTLHSLGKYKEAIERFNKAISLKSDYFAAYINRGISLNSLGKYKRALESFNQVIEKKPDYVEAYIHKGHSLRFLKKYQEALENFNQVIKLRPNDPEAYLHRAELLKMIGKQKEAKENYCKAMELNPNYHETFISQGKQLNRTGKHQEAVEIYNKALELKPNNTEAYLNKGTSLNELGKHQEALESYNKAIVLQPENPEVYYKKGIALGKMGKNQESLENYNLAIELKPNHSEAHNKKGNLLDHLGRHEEALASYNEAIILQPDCSEGYENKGSVLDNMGKYEEAVESYEKAVELQPNDVILHCNLASNMIKAGNEKGALEEFHKAELLLETKEQKEMDEGTVNLVKGALSKITEVENVANEADEVLKELDHESPAVQKLQKTFNKIQGKKKDILAGLNFRKCAELSTGELEAIRKEILKAQKEIKNLKATTDKTKEKLGQVEQELENKMDDFHKKLVSTLTSQGMNKKEIEKLQGYFSAFLDTFSLCYNTSQVVESGQVELDMGNDIADILSTLASFSPFFGDAISNGISKIGEFLAMKEIKTNARKMLNLAADTSHMSQIAGEVGYRILVEKKVQKVILTKSEKVLNQGFDSKLEKIINFCKDLGEKVETKLFTERYKTSYRKLGNNDAIGLIELWLEKGCVGRLDIEEIKKKFVEKILEDYENFENGSAGLGNQIAVNPKSNKANCCNIF